MNALIELIRTHLASSPSKQDGLRAIADATQIPFTTLRNWLYGNRTAPSNERVSTVLDAIGIYPGDERHRRVWTELGVKL